MTAIATFDRQGQLQDITACEQAACPLAEALGVRWGQRPAVSRRVHRLGAAIALTRAPGWLHGWQGLCTQERLRFTGAAVVNRTWDTASRRHELIGENHVACLLLQGVGLFWLRTAEGYTGVLLQAGEWISVPAGTPHVFDGGSLEALELVRLSTGPRGWFPLSTGRVLPPRLPSLDTLVSRVLAELGEAPA